MATIHKGDQDYIPKQLSIEMIRNGTLYLKHDQYGRVHTNLTSLSRQFRPFLSVQGKPLRTVDIRNSQPFFLNLVLDNYTMNNNEINSFHKQETQPPIPHPFQYGGCPVTPSQNVLRQLRQLEEQEARKEGRLPQPHNPSNTMVGQENDLLKYRELTCRGLFYDHLMTKMGIPQDQRNEWKREFFGGVFFCSNHTQSKYKELFREEFPIVYEIVADLKRKDHAHLAHYLQRAESSVMIHRICRRLMEDSPDAPVLTIHDSISTTPDHVDTVLGVMREEFAGLGLTPTFHIGD